MTSLLPSHAAKWASSIAGVLIAVLDAVQQINQYSTFSTRPLVLDLQYSTL